MKSALNREISACLAPAGVGWGEPPPGMSALPPKADIIGGCVRGPLLTQSGHSLDYEVQKVCVPKTSDLRTGSYRVDAIFVCFTPVSRHSGGSRKTSAYDPKRTFNQFDSFQSNSSETNASIVWNVSIGTANSAPNPECPNPRPSRLIQTTS